MLQGLKIQPPTLESQCHCQSVSDISTFKVFYTKHFLHGLYDYPCTCNIQLQ